MSVFVFLMEGNEGKSMKEEISSVPIPTENIVLVWLLRLGNCTMFCYWIQCPRSSFPDTIRVVVFQVTLTTEATCGGGVGLRTPLLYSPCISWRPRFPHDNLLSISSSSHTPHIRWLGIGDWGLLRCESGATAPCVGHWICERKREYSGQLRISFLKFWIERTHPFTHSETVALSWLQRYSRSK